MSIYTKTGDGGETSLYGGQRVPKNHERLLLLGDLDELNSHLGLLASYLKSWKASANLSQYNNKFLDFHLRFLEILQSAIFELGTIIGDPKNQNPKSDSFGLLVKRLEAAVDIMEKDLPKLANFILPGGSAGAAYAHICRAVTRRAERSYFALAKSEPTAGGATGAFINRLSDYLFMLARFLNKQSKIDDVIWRG